MSCRPFLSPGRLNYSIPAKDALVPWLSGALGDLEMVPKRNPGVTISPVWDWRARVGGNWTWDLRINWVLQI